MRKRRVSRLPRSALFKMRPLNQFAQKFLPAHVAPPPALVPYLEQKLRLWALHQFMLVPRNLPVVTWAGPHKKPIPPLLLNRRHFNGFLLALYNASAAPPAVRVARRVYAEANECVKAWVASFLAEFMQNVARCCNAAGFDLASLADVPASLVLAINRLKNKKDVDNPI